MPNSTEVRAPDPDRAPVRVLLVVAEPMVRLQLRRLISGRPEFEVAGTVRSEAEIEGAVAETRSSVVLVDGRDARTGAAAAIRLAARCGLRGVLLQEDRASLGANSLPCPTNLAAEEPGGAFMQQLAGLLRVPASASAPAARLAPARPGFRPELIAIGSSTGGPQALTELVRALAGRRPSVPVLLTQHMPSTFTAMLADQLSRCGFPAVEATDGMPLQPGRIHVAPGGSHLLVRRDGDRLVCVLDDGPPENFCRPAVDPMLRAANRVANGRVLAVILTGMGSDGLLGCQGLVAAGGVVLAQDEATSVVWGMPGAVARAGLCHAVLPLSAMADAVARLATGGLS
ncbi:chemotaxis protein CheB [Paracraurococcus lichenis]|uniref:protein-glutamate methylesterase n=1 Tax=Paracraurococcus lichenis TaxID=3064888 RepID=A0ABT9EDC6_9PROT|nr:chemotaxis protein CheB [Paracraurococcus sp. LOR1-02]MDO9714231.1 chemotaxis protein CheB [Paracraurococcus sp. LOR1-02]